MASSVVRLRSAARRGDHGQLQGIIGELEQRVTEAESLSKTETAKLLRVSVNTLDKWIGRGVIPTITDARYKRARIPVRAALKLAAEVDDLRHLGRDRGVLAAAMSRLEQRDPEWQRAFDDQYGESLDAMRRGDLVELDLDSFGSND